jgi:hypothetical protein
MKTELIIPSLQQIVNFFKEETIDQIARETGFSLRKRKLSAIVFLGIFTFGLIQKADATLAQLVSIGKRILSSLHISPQGLHKRINHLAVDFLMRMFAKSLALSIDTDEKLVPLLGPFNRVNLNDSSYITLPEEVAKLFPAPGGSASKAGAKIQLMIDYKSGNFSHLWLTDALTPDQNQMYIAQNHIDKGELLIHDEGFSQDALAKLVEAGAFFLGRFQTQTALYTITECGEYKRLLLWEILKQTQQPVREIPVCLGAKARLLCRFIIQRIPDCEVEKRKRKLRARAKKKGKTVSKEKLALCGFSLYVTNVDSHVFPASVVPSVYSLRWQIELVFKAIKSHLGFELIAGKLQARICCQLYGKLIVLVLSLFLTCQFRKLLWRSCKRDLSLLKTFAHLPIVAPIILETLRDSLGLLATLRTIALEIISLCRMDKRRTRLSTAETLRAIVIVGEGSG